MSINSFYRNYCDSQFNQ